MVVNPVDMDELGNEVRKWLVEKYENRYGGWVKIVVERFYNDEQLKVIVTIQGFRYFMIHLQTVEHFGMNKVFNQECIHYGIITENKIALLHPKIDILVRAAELVHHPYRDWHHQYILDYLEEYDERLADEAYLNNPEFLKQIKQTINYIAAEKRIKSDEKIFKKDMALRI